MARTQEPTSASPASFRRSSTSHHPHNANMNPYPGEMTPAQQEAQSILVHILQKLQDPESKYSKKYAKWIERHANLDEFLFCCVRPEVWRYLQSGNGSLDSLKTIGGDLKFEGRAVYLNGVLGLDKRIRTYVGQTNSLRTRVYQHLNFRYRRDNPSFHYHALQNSTFNIFGVLAVLPSSNLGNHALPGMDCPDLMLNVLEMWSSLIFRTLQEDTLRAWLPEGTKLRSKGTEHGPLNIAVPLDQGSKSVREWLDLSKSEDPLLVEYIGHGERKKSQVQYVEKKTKDVSYASGDRPVEVPLGTMIVFGTAIFLGIMLLRGGGGRPASVPTLKPQWRW
ncbi:hypothetical protein BDV95DRAFT_576210 [Massariosphaeria phaeospora]|uniref:GIY-YIG domain-containing protein n=1 Tax=Massariosphaeria phaeospora TaxID=100035 RepID=A0A7C8I3A2_9PLEO|nr:hypothetical protein BDV95DRAFT_576210 [Massariosphaeria phaeospora]